MGHRGDLLTFKYVIGRTARYVLAIAALVVILVGCRDSTDGDTDTSADEVPSPSIKGRVVSIDGEAVSEATVSAGDEQKSTDSNGEFELPIRSSSEWLTVEHPDFLSRTRAATTDSPLLLRLTPDDGETVSINFTGDAMFGRRFYDPNEDGDTSDGLLQPGDGAGEHLALLEDVKPLLENADITAVNLESPLTDEPYYNPLKPRPAKFHPTKDFAFASDPSSAVALKEAGVDVVGLGNNHLYDVLDQGVSDSLNSLEQAGFQPGAGYFGAGFSNEEAWRPSVVTSQGQSVAFLGCTTITGFEHEISYVASGTDKAGAANCYEGDIQDKVAAAKAKYDVVVLMIHGGYEYGREPSNNIQQLTTAAREAGATLVINHHPHVTGGFEWDGSSLVAQTLGNFVFDQTVWPTFESYLLTVNLRRGQVVNAYAEPLMIEDYLPKGLTGELADYVARGAAGRESGPFLIEDGAMQVDIKDTGSRRDVSLSLDGESGAGSIYDLSKGSWVSEFSGDGSIWLGRDLLWVGSFEDDDVDAQNQEGALWDLEGEGKYLGSEYAYKGEVGARLERENINRDAIVLTPVHRILVDPGKKLSVGGMVRTDTNADLTLQLSWYADTKGASATQTYVPVNVESDGEWEAFRVDVTVPPNAVAIGLYLRLEPPPYLGEVQNSTADLDNIHIIEWAPAGSEFSPLYDHFALVGPGQVTLSEAFLPGAEEWATPEEPQELPRGKIVTSSVPDFPAATQQREEE